MTDKRFAVGDLVTSCIDGQQTHARRIEAVRPSGYDWSLADYGAALPNGANNLFHSENGNDPLFEAGWQRVQS